MNAEAWEEKLAAQHQAAIANYLAEIDEARQMLRDLGFGVAGTPIKEQVKCVEAWMRGVWDAEQEVIFPMEQFSTMPPMDSSTGLTIGIGTCQMCHREVYLSSDGTFDIHNRQDGTSPCFGSGMVPFGPTEWARLAAQEREKMFTTTSPVDDIPDVKPADVESFHAASADSLTDSRPLCVCPLSTLTSSGCQCGGR